MINYTVTKQSLQEQQKLEDDWKQHLKEYHQIPRVRKKRLMKAKQHYKENVEEIRKRTLICMKKLTKKFRLIIINHYTNGTKRCNCCNQKFENMIFLTIDHVNNDGIHERKTKTGNGLPLLRKIIKNNFPKDYQILCWNCNLGKHLNGGICPHQDKN